MSLRFGTDGVRGVANVELTPELALALGRAGARVLGGATVVVGRDTRRSGPMLAGALAGGFASEGVDVADLGVVPTPAVAHASAALAAVGAMVSASHNRFPDNGIKFFLPGGHKLGDDVEDRLEAELDRVLTGATNGAVPSGRDVGRFVDARGHRGHYVDHVVASIEGRRLGGLTVVLDCAEGAAFELAPDVFERLGADVTVIHDRPDGTNINEACGSTHPADLRAAVRERGADVGLAFDGDADRVLAVDATGEVVDGDQIMAVCALDRHRRGRLAGATVVVTVMTNLGFRQAMAAHGIEVVQTAVGDRAVLEAMQAGGFTVGGEQSGHVVFGDLATTGDGLLTGVQLLDAIGRADRPLGDLAAVMPRLPQVLRNVALAHRGVDVAARLAPDIAAAEAELGGGGRVLVRPSGTEPLVRVMVEAPTALQAEAVAARLVGALGALDALDGPRRAGPGSDAGAAVT